MKKNSERYNRSMMFNPLSLAEPQAALGIGYHQQFTARSGYFIEVSAVFKSPFYGGADPITGGYRGILQYRYQLIKKHRRNHFVAAEFRLKRYGFIGSNNFGNTTIPDTLRNYNYKALATSLGGGILTGTLFDISKNDRWYLEMTIGIGAKRKFVKYENLPPGYALLMQRRPDSFGPPDIDEAVGIPYFPLLSASSMCCVNESCRPEDPGSS
ncbi:MAG: hypothetical protein ABIY51_13225 [Ferruginibacter sp.]